MIEFCYYFYYNAHSKGNSNSLDELREIPFGARNYQEVNELTPSRICL